MEFESNMYWIPTAYSECSLITITFVQLYECPPGNFNIDVEMAEHIFICVFIKEHLLIQIKLKLVALQEV